MNRLLVIALVASIGNASAAFAGESILTSGARHAQQLAVADASVEHAPRRLRPPAGATVDGRPEGDALVPGRRRHALEERNGEKARRRMIYVGLAVAFAATVWTIDHNVLDITPSSLGTRQD